MEMQPHPLLKLVPSKRAWLVRTGFESGLEVSQNGLEQELYNSPTGQII